MMKTVAILHGWAGGNWHVKEFASVLKKNNLTVIKNARVADVIFAHSTGCYRVPEGGKAKVVILQGPPYWPSQNILKRLLKKTIHAKKTNIKNKGYVYTLHKFIWEIIYALIKPSYVFIALKNHRYLHFLDLLEKKKVILVRNEEDYFCSPEIKQAVKKYKNVHYLELPGGHDDFMTNPAPYVDLITKHL